MKKNPHIALLALLGTFALSSVHSKAALVAYYSFDAETAADDSGTGNNGTLVGSTTFSDTVLPGALTGSTHSAYFDGDGDRINIAHSSSLAFTSEIMSISLWMKYDTVGGDAHQRLIGKGVDADDGGIEIQRSNLSTSGNFRVDTSQSANQTTNLGVIWDQGWHHIAIAVNNGVVTVWRDGVKTIGSYNDSGNSGFGNTRQLVLGATDRQGGREFGGWMDDVAFWDNEITASDVAGLYAGTLSPLTVVPEPSTALLGALGALALLRRRR